MFAGVVGNRERCRAPHSSQGCGHRGGGDAWPSEDQSWQQRRRGRCCRRGAAAGRAMSPRRRGRLKELRGVAFCLGGARERAAHARRGRGPMPPRSFVNSPCAPTTSTPGSADAIPSRAIRPSGPYSARTARGGARRCRTPYCPASRGCTSRRRRTARGRSTCVDSHRAPGRRGGAARHGRVAGGGAALPRAATERHISGARPALPGRRVRRRTVRGLRRRPDGEREPGRRRRKGASLRLVQVPTGAGHRDRAARLGPDSTVTTDVATVAQECPKVLIPQWFCHLFRRAERATDIRCTASVSLRRRR